MPTARGLWEDLYLLCAIVAAHARGVGLPHPACGVGLSRIVPATLESAGLCPCGAALHRRFEGPPTIKPKALPTDIYLTTQIIFFGAVCDTQKRHV